MSGWNGKPKALIRAERQASIDNQPLTARCALCRWKYTGLAGKARLYARRHREKHHPGMVDRERSKHWTRRRHEVET